MRLVALVLLATAAIAASPAQAALTADHGRGNSDDHPSSSSGGNRSGEQGYQGVVQSVSARTIVAKALDGSVVGIPIDSRTRYSVGDRPASLSDIRPGFVVNASWKNGYAAEEVKAYDPAPQSASWSVASVGADRIVVTSSDGSTTTIHVSSKTRIFVNGKAATLRDVKPGYVLVGSTDGTKDGRAAGELRFVTR